MFTISSVGRRSLSCAKRFASSAGPAGSQKKQSAVSKAISFVSKNRQQLINIFAIYLVVSFGVHNFKVQKAWEERDEEVKKTIAESNSLKEALLNKEWIGELDKKVRASKPAQNVLLTELEARLAAFPINETVAKAVAAETKAEPVAKSVSNLVGKDPVGIVVNSGSKDSSRVI